MLLADPRLIKIIAHGDDVAGFLFAFPDVSAALQRAKGHLFPFAMPTCCWRCKRTKWIALNGAGILPDFRGAAATRCCTPRWKKPSANSVPARRLDPGGRDGGADAADLINLGGKPYKNHRVYGMDI